MMWSRHNGPNSSVPVCSDMVHFVQDVAAWLGEDPDNVIAVHCKGGKGRTGLMVCTYLMQTDYFKEVDVSA